ncbi:MAG: carbamate kinase [Candidatus Marinimicrobia bacterium]|nr:carbamate kinase [Candidatus Neomarinimicrobiota bacterium]
MEKSVIIALGGNALSPKGEAGTIHQQFAHTRESLDAIMHFVTLGYNICLTHGNGPQVGDELFRMELTHSDVPPLPLGICVAETQGSIGYMIQQSLQNSLKLEEIDREVVTLITQTIVDANDPSIKNPSKYIGQQFPKEEANKMVEKFGWTVKEQNPGEWRQVVPSPLPQYIEHGKSIQTLVDNGIIVIASGGGGIPAYLDKNGNIEGLDAVVDKDLSAALLGRVIKANELWIITDVDKVCLNFGTNEEQQLTEITASEAKTYNEEGHFQAGSMGPKIQAALYFLKHHGDKVVITSIEGVKEAINGNNGTIVRN